MLWWRGVTKVRQSLLIKAVSIKGRYVNDVADEDPDGVNR